MSEGVSDTDLVRLGLEVDLDTIPSAVLRQIIAEVRAAEEDTPSQEEDRPTGIQGYNRTHNRHNRGGDASWPRREGYNRVHNRHNRG